MLFTFGMERDALLGSLPSSALLKADWAFFVLNSFSRHSKNSVNVIKDLAALSVPGLQVSR